MGTFLPRRIQRAASLLRHELIAERIERANLRLNSLGDLLDSYSYERVLARGFALVRDAANLPLTTAAAVAPGAALRIRFTDGEVAATADGHAAKAKPRAPRPPNPEQGSLL